ncbi:MAG: PASTA domain-containing protein, partial [Stackebrandtia sp.]
PPPVRRDGRSSRARAFMVATAVVALLAVGGIAAARPWEGTGDRSAQSGDDTSIVDSTGEAEDDDSDPESSTPEDTTFSSSPSQTPSSSSDSPSPTDSSSSSSEAEDPTGSVPDLTGLSESDAYGALEAEGFTNGYSYPVTDGDYDCAVVEQDPAPGTEAGLDEDVSFGVEYAESPDACDTVGTETEPPPAGEDG